MFNKPAKLRAVVQIADPNYPQTESRNTALLQNLYKLEVETQYLIKFVFFTIKTEKSVLDTGIGK